MITNASVPPEAAKIDGKPADKKKDARKKEK